MENKNYALVTGASSGIGLAIAKELAKKNYHLVLVSKDESQKSICKEISETYSIDAVAIVMDLAHPDAAKTLYDFCVQNNYQVSVLVNNAGEFIFKRFLEIEEEKIKIILQLHINTVTFLCYYFGEQMKNRRNGYILNISSLSAWMHYPGLNIYQATKSYIKQFSLALHYELRDYGVCVTTATPGAVATNLFRIPQNQLDFGLKIGLIMPPEKLAKNVLRSLFKRKKLVMPGLINYFFKFVIPVIPVAILLKIAYKFDILSNPKKNIL